MEAIHLAMLEVLERTGIFVEDDEALDILRNYEPAPREEDVRCELRHVVGNADQQLRS